MLWNLMKGVRGYRSQARQERVRAQQEGGRLDYGEEYQAEVAASLLQDALLGLYRKR